MIILHNCFQPAFKRWWVFHHYFSLIYNCLCLLLLWYGFWNPYLLISDSHIVHLSLMLWILLQSKTPQSWLRFNLFSSQIIQHSQEMWRRSFVTLVEIKKNFLKEEINVASYPESVNQVMGHIHTASLLLWLQAH